jgi:Fe2+ or Zn2+ uptake regulation protein
MGTRNSLQRNRILQLLQAERVHVSASWIHDTLRMEFPRISLGNVYRNLQILVDQGSVHRLPLAKDNHVFEAVREDHHHFICDQCGAIIDIDPNAPVFATVNQSLREQKHEVKQVSLEVRGICSACRQTK